MNSKFIKTALFSGALMALASGVALADPIGWPSWMGAPVTEEKPLLVAMGNICQICLDRVKPALAGCKNIPEERGAERCIAAACSNYFRCGGEAACTNPPPPDEC